MLYTPHKCISINPATFTIAEVVPEIYLYPSQWRVHYLDVGWGRVGPQPVIPPTDKEGNHQWLLGAFRVWFKVRDAVGVEGGIPEAHAW